MTPFYKLSGGGNDFLALVEPDAPPDAGRIRAWCARGLSIGADGLFVLRRADGGARMDYFNADGRPAELCLNATRCAARLAFELGWAEGGTSIATGAGPVAARRAAEDEVSLELPPPAAAPREVALEALGATHRGWTLSVGVPHLVLLWRGGLAGAPVAALGPALRAHPELGPAGANVDFARFPARGRLEIRTWERGVEGETLACGTGVLAAAAVGVARGVATLPLAALTQGGFRLRVEGRSEEGRITAWSLAGDARIVAEGRLAAAAERLPAPPAWS